MKTYFIFDSPESHLSLTKAAISFHSYTPSMSNQYCAPSVNNSVSSCPLLKRQGNCLRDKANLKPGDITMYLIMYSHSQEYLKRNIILYFINIQYKSTHVHYTLRYIQKLNPM